MINKKIEAAINKQINAEFYSAYLYLSMAAYCESQNLNGFANWMRVQFQEEQAHAMIMYDYVNERGGRVTLDLIEKPPAEWKSIADVFSETYQHEQKVTGLINALVTLAIEEQDHATNNFLQWFVGEQVEEEATASDLLEQLKMIGDNGYGLLMLDREMKQRVFNPPSIAN